MFGWTFISLSGRFSAPVRVRLEVQLATAAIGYVRIDLRGREIRMAEHLLHGAQVCAAFEQVRGERVAEQVRMHTFRLEPGLGGEPSQDQECPRPREPAALGVEEELGAVPR